MKEGRNEEKKIPQKMRKKWQRKKMANEPVLALWAFCSQNLPLSLLHGGTDVTGISVNCAHPLMLARVGLACHAFFMVFVRE
jgi:hypothetical protein